MMKKNLMRSELGAYAYAGYSHTGKNLFIRKLSNNEKDLVYQVLYEGKKHGRNKFVEAYFKNHWLIYGAFTPRTSDNLIAYCIVKNPKTRPEFANVTLTKYRNRGVITAIMDQVLKWKEFDGNVIYAACKFDNFGSFKSLLKVGFVVFDLTKDGYVQFVKVLGYTS